MGSWVPLRLAVGLPLSVICHHKGCFLQEICIKYTSMLHAFTLNNIYLYSLLSLCKSILKLNLLIIMTNKTDETSYMSVSNVSVHKVFCDCQVTRCCVDADGLTGTSDEQRRDTDDNRNASLRDGLHLAVSTLCTPCSCRTSSAPHHAQREDG